MERSGFVGHLGPPGLHDGTVMAIRQFPTTLAVDVATHDGDLIVVTFSGVSSVRQNRPIGMLLYSLSEMRSEGSGRAFSFANSEDGDELLEVVAESVAFV